MMNLIARDVPLGSIKPAASAFAPLAGSGEDVLTIGTPLVKFMSTIIGFLTTIAGLYFLIQMILAGLSWISAGGEKGKVESARSQMTNAALGLIIIIAAYSIVGIVGNVLGLDILNPIVLLRSLRPSAL